MNKNTLVKVGSVTPMQINGTFDVHTAPPMTDDVVASSLQSA